MNKLVAKIVDGKDLTGEEARILMTSMMEGELSSPLIGAALTALRIKGETVEELTGFATVMREKALSVPIQDTDVVDTCGTGGDGGRTFNISTAAAIVAAAAGVKVAKHGNRAVSSQSGSADVLEALGFPIEVEPKEVCHQLYETNLCFLFAPFFHRAMKHVMPTRKALGFHTCFNLLGPLANPARVKRQLVGVYDPSLTALVAEVLLALGAERVLVVAGLDGMDEISITSPTQVSEVKNGQVHTYLLTPEELNLTRANVADLAGGNAQENAQIIRGIFMGERGPKREVVVANAGAVIAVAGQAHTIQEGITRAAEAIDSGRAFERLTQITGSRERISYVS